MLGRQDTGTDAKQLIAELRGMGYTKWDCRPSMWAIHALATCTTNKTNNHSYTMAAYITVVYTAFTAEGMTQVYTKNCALKVH